MKIGTTVRMLFDDVGFSDFGSCSGLDVGPDRSSPVSDYEAPFPFTGRLRRVIVDLADDQDLDHEAVGRAETARE